MHVITTWFLEYSSAAFLIRLPSKRDSSLTHTYVLYVYHATTDNFCLKIQDSLGTCEYIQGVLIENYPKVDDVELKRYIFNPMLVKPKCV